MLSIFNKTVIVPTVTTFGADNTVIDLRKSYDFILTGADWTKELVFTFITTNQSSIITSLKGCNKTAIVPADKDFPSVFKNNKDSAKANTVTKTITISAFKKLKKVEHCPFPYPYVFGVIMGIASFYLIYRICKILSSKKE